MSVEVKTPTRTQFEHPEFHCGERGVGSAHLLDELPTNVTGVRVGGIILHSQGCEPSGSQTQATAKSFHRKRKLSDRGGNPHQAGNRKKPYRKGERMVRPSKFLLGGNITDPLNLNALYDDDVGKALNQITPQSSPMPVPPYKQEVQVLIPPNINDPLNLNAGEEADLISPKFGNKKKKHKHKKKRLNTMNDKPEHIEDTAECTTVHELSPPQESNRPASLELKDITTSMNPSHKCTSFGEKLSKELDKIVSPVIPQQPPKAKKAKRLSSEISRTEDEESTGKDVEKSGSRKATPQKTKAKRQTSIQSMSEGKGNSTKDKERFQYGNYNKYYGYRNPGEQEDNRLSCFRADWFTGKDVLDIGCNIGHITLSVAKMYSPHKIIGMDIDKNLVSVAKKNIRHYMTKDAIDTSKFPNSLHLTYGPIAPPPVPASQDASGFPFNVLFMQGNYVLESEQELELVQEEYDTILALSITKWIHLNWGDAGLKRMFKRVYRHLRPGGRFVLEPQPWASYKRKKKMTDAIFKTFQQISFRPEQFTEYLLSKEVGFVACEHLDIPFNHSEGFQRPLQVYLKSESGTTPLEGVTPLMDVDCTPGTTPHTYTPYRDTSHGATPKLDAGSSGMTPCSSCHNTPTYLHGAWSAGGTPRYDSDTGESGTPRTQDSCDKAPNSDNQELQSRTTDNG